MFASPSSTVAFPTLELALDSLAALPSFWLSVSLLFRPFHFLVGRADVRGATGRADGCGWWSPGACATSAAITSGSARSTTGAATTCAPGTRAGARTGTSAARAPGSSCTLGHSQC